MAVSISRLAASFAHHRANGYKRSTPEKRPLRPAQRSIARAFRLEELAAWLDSRYYGAIKRAFGDRFPEYYPELTKSTRGERRLYRDLAVLLASGRFVRVDHVVIRADRAARIS